MTIRTNMATFADMKRAIVLGASSGIGREVSRQLLAKGWYVGVAARRENRLNEIKVAYPDRVEVMTIDVTAEDAASRLLSFARQMGGLNLFVYSAGVGSMNEQLDPDTELATTAVNVTGFTRVIDAIFHYMADNLGGDIAVVTSITGTKGIGVAPSYSATKAYQNTYIQALEQLSNMRRLHIRFTDIRPGFVDTPLLSGDKRYPMLMDKVFVAREIVRAVETHRHVKVIDLRYALLTFFWRLIPNRIWRRLNIRVK